MNGWAFPVSPETRVLTLRTIRDGRSPILFVEHDENGEWHCYDGRETFLGSELALAPLSRLIEQEPNLAELADLPKGHRARRFTPDGPWERESSALLEKTRQRAARALEELTKHQITLPPGSPSSLEMLREGRGE
jgi:hypothetical protein